MGTPQTETQLLQFWSKLSGVQKELMLTIIQEIAEKGEEATVPDEHLQLLKRDLELYEKGIGNISTREELKERIRQIVV